MEEHNPFQSPEWGDKPPSSAVPIPNSRYVKQVRVVAGLMIAQGVLELLMGSVLGVMAGVFPAVVDTMPPEQAAQFEVTYMAVMYGVFAAVHLGAGVLHIVAGIRNFRYKSRALGIVALGAGLGTIVTCLCFPTGVALAVYGLIVYLNEEVAFVFRQQSAA